jgi:branched-subunit amino acid aminotransferase/4-amino-4-deoxychorismate lyase
MTFLRWFFAVLMLAPFAIPHVVRDWNMVRANWKALAFLGVIGVGTHNALAYLGLNYTTATNGVILNSFIPVMIIAMSWLFLNERGEVGEGTITNVVFDRGEGLRTPPLASGCLPGILRAELLERGAREEVLRAEDLPRVRLWVGNALRGLVAAALA